MDLDVDQLCCSELADETFPHYNALLEPAAQLLDDLLSDFSTPIFIAVQVHLLLIFLTDRPKVLPKRRSYKRNIVYPSIVQAIRKVV